MWLAPGHIAKLPVLQDYRFLIVSHYIIVKKGVAEYTLNCFSGRVACNRASLLLKTPRKSI